MISVICTNCRAELTIDDAFAGGVCRCEHCGAIQTVPLHLKSGKLAGIGAKRSQRTLYRKPPREDGMPSSGLDQLAQVVASSGIGSDRFRAEDEENQSTRAGLRRVLLFLGLSTALLLGVIALWIGLSTAPASQAGPPGPGPNASSPHPTTNAVKAPHFCEIPLSERVVVYVLDRGSGTADLFSYVKEVAFRSAESLGPERRFQIIFWNNGSGEAAYPFGSPTFATPQNIEAARKGLDNVFAHGQTDITSALTIAISTNPEAIVLATGKAAQLDDAFVEQVMKIVGKREDIRIHTMDIGGSQLSPALKTIAEKTRGKAHLITEGELKRAARE